MKFKSNILVGLTFIAGVTGCGSHSAGTVAAPAQKQAENQIVQSPNDQIIMEKVATPALPADLAAQPTFATEGFVIASETYTNLNDHTVKLEPSQAGTSLVLQTQILNRIIDGTQNSSSSSLPVVLSVTAKSASGIERIADSIEADGIDLKAGENVTLNWRISPAPGLPLCRNLLECGLAGIETTAEGAQLVGELTRSVGFSDGTNNAMGKLIVEDFREALIIGTVNTTPNLYGSGNCVWVSL